MAGLCDSFRTFPRCFRILERRRSLLCILHCEFLRISYHKQTSSVHETRSAQDLALACHRCYKCAGL